MEKEGRIVSWLYVGAVALLLFGGAFFYANYAEAKTSGFQLEATATSTGRQDWRQLIGNGWESSDYSLQIQALGVVDDPGIATTTIRAEILQCTDVTCANQDWGSGTVEKIITAQGHGDFATYTFSWGVENLNPVKYHELRVNATTAGASVALKGSPSSTAFLTATEDLFYWSGSQFKQDANVKDAWFQFGGLPEVYSAAFVYPTNGTTTPDFSHWNYRVALKPGFTYNLRTTYSSTDDFSGDVNMSDWWTRPVSSATSTIAAIKYTILDPGTVYYAYLEVRDEAGMTLYTSNTIGFLVESSGSGDEVKDTSYRPPPSTLSADWISVCEDVEAGYLGLAKLMCKISVRTTNTIQSMLISLFSPSQDKVEKLGDIADLLAVKPPFAYWTAASDGLALLASGTSTLPAATLDALEGIPLFATFRTAFTWLLWFLFLVWLIKRMAQYDF